MFLILIACIFALAVGLPVLAVAFLESQERQKKDALFDQQLKKLRRMSKWEPTNG